MTLTPTTLRPGLLVSLKTSIKGNVNYVRQDLENVKTDDGAERARWETMRTVFDPVEHERATKARNKAGALVRGACAGSAFGLLCPEANRDALDAAVRQAHDVVDEFNRSAKITTVSVYVIVGRVAADDVEAMRAINSEISDLMTRMESGVRNLDVAEIREAANKAREMGAMLSPAASERVANAITLARAAARKIAKAGEQASQEVDLQTVAKITEARLAFLDLDHDATSVAPVAAPAEEGRTLDLTPTETPAAPANEVPDLEIDGTQGQDRESYSDTQDRDSYSVEA